MFTGTVRRFLENYGNSIEAVVFAVSETEEVCIIYMELYEYTLRKEALTTLLLFIFIAIYLIVLLFIHKWSRNKLLVTFHKQGMSRANTQDLYPSDIGQNLRIENNNKKKQL